jgi:hypothetical protein
MDYTEWEPLYKEILREFDFSKEGDEASARVLESLIPRDSRVGPEELSKMVDSNVTIFGCAPDLDEALHGRNFKGTLISAGGSTSVLTKNGICPDIMVTDLDGPVEADIECNRRGSLAVLHAHSDNVRLIQRYAGSFSGKIVVSTQSKPIGDMINFGGFTDGDRAVMLARALGAKRLTLVGFDFEHPTFKAGSDSRVKRKKLAWAKKLIFEFNSSEIEIDLI